MEFIKTFWSTDLLDSSKIKKFNVKTILVNQTLTAESRNVVLIAIYIVLNRNGE